ncbi:MAG TPA: flavodoxin FldB [Psychromonas hadalis]|nr:flavodoxin FldB [Psychromonas hadalis]
MKIGLFYGSSTCYTEIVAEKIQAMLQATGKIQVDLFNIKTDPISKVNDYQTLIFGISTWDYGELQEDWGIIWGDLDEIAIKGKTIALYGLGDQEGYGEWFLDAMGMLHDQLLPQSPHIIGYWPTEGYEFTASKATISNDQFFVGLAIDEDTQYELTDERVTEWCLQLQEALKK